MDTEKYRLKDILTIGNGKDHKELNDGPYPVYGSGGFMRNADSYLYDGESVLLPRKGTLSNIQYVNGKFWTVDTCYYTKINTSIVIPYYLFRLLRSYDLSGLDSGASIPSMTSKTYYGIKINLPKLDVQKRISDLLLQFDKLIEINNKKIKILEQMEEELYKEWFVRFRFPGYETTEYENGIPKGWEIKRLNSFGNIETGKTPSTEKVENYGDEFLFVKTPEMHGKTFVIDTEEKLSLLGHNTQPKKLLPPNSIMVSCIGSGGIVALNAFQAHTNQQINSIVPKNEVYLEWLFYTCKNLKSTIEMFGATGTTMTNLSKGKFERLKVIEPTENYVLLFHNTINPILKTIKELQYINQNLIKQRDLLLPRLMCGKLEV